MTYDNDHVYVAVNVIDERVIVGDDNLPWDQDGIEICVDGRDDPDRSMNPRDYGEPWRTFAYLAFSPAQSADKKVSVVFESDRVPDGVQFASRRTDEGYAAEVAIPHHALDAFREEGSWEALRLNIGIHDADETLRSDTVLWWQPDWHSEERIPGSGTFLPAGSR